MEKTIWTHVLYFRDIEVAEEAEKVIGGLLNVSCYHTDGTNSFNFGLEFETEQELSHKKLVEIFDLTEAFGCVFNK
jgi:hypothetical protein